MSWKTMSVLLLLAVGFLVGILGLNGIEVVVIWAVCSILIAVILGGSRIQKAIKENAGTRKVIIAAILIVLVLIPLAFLGTCLLFIGGSSMRSLFVPVR
jgi:asparagine N-glycosylation enzyme membrane subunit Stt3